MPESLGRVPAHLRRFVVEQDYAEYTAVDQSVWRFVLLQMYAKLQHTAHAAYREGLSRTGISVERIPSLREMDECLSEFGWGAVCVDGFIPPRAFTEFQALGLLPICAEIRSADHLVYTPAPDIIHEAAGHAPIIVDRRYAEFLKRIGEVGARAFRAPEDDAVYDAIYELSEIKERPGATREAILAAEAALERAKREERRVSEATRLSRLYWWTAEYGLVGTPEDYKLYGAGLLSSLGESHSCHAPGVRKLPLTPDCVETSYDITRAQPQLFVARDFEHLNEVLEAVANTLSYRMGGEQALLEAHHSQELSTLTLDSGLQVIGEVTEAIVNREALVSLARVVGRTALAEHDVLVNDGPPIDSELWILFGRLADGSALSLQSARRVRLELGNGLLLTAAPLGEAWRGRVLRVEDLRFEQSGRLLAEAPQALLLVADRLTGARAGAADLNYYCATGFSAQKVPKPRSFPPKKRAMIALYERALQAHACAPSPAMLECFGQIHDTLTRDFPRDWLLRWNMLESLVKRQERGPLTQQLERELWELERLYEGREPIATGLGYLGFASGG